VLVLGITGSVVSPARAQGSATDLTNAAPEPTPVTPAPVTAPTPVMAPVTPCVDQPGSPPCGQDTPQEAATEESAVRRQANGRGFVFHPSLPRSGGFRFAVGAFYDAVDPAVMYGVVLRVPQLTMDARFGLGDGWSIKGHLNTMLVTNELLFGVSKAWQMGRWSIEGSASVGIYVGKLAQFAFDAAMFSPEYRPEITIGYDMGSVALSARGSLLLMGPEQVRIGELWGGFDNANLFVGHSEMLYVENTTKEHGIWYFGLGAMTTRAYYQLWLLFPDSPGLYTYPRIVAGYEF
jgi:hypothetical protein